MILGDILLFIFLSNNSTRIRYAISFLFNLSSEPLKKEQQLPPQLKRTFYKLSACNIYKLQALFLYDHTKFREATVQTGTPIPLYMDGNFNNRNILDLCKPTKLRVEGVSKCFELAVYIWNDNFSTEVFLKLVQLYKFLKKSVKTALPNGYYMEAKKSRQYERTEMYAILQRFSEMVAKMLLPFPYTWKAILALKLSQNLCNHTNF